MKIERDYSRKYWRNFWKVSPILITRGMYADIKLEVWIGPYVFYIS